MKLFKNPVFAVILCLLLIFCSTCLSVKVKMEKRYDKICDNLYDEILEYAEDNRIDELKSQAHDASATGDYRGLIAAFDELSAGRKFDDTDDVDDAIRDYNKFLRKTQQFPAKVFVDLLNITF